MCMVDYPHELGSVCCKAQSRMALREIICQYWMALAARGADTRLEVSDKGKPLASHQ